MPEVRLIDANALLKKCIEGDGDNKFTEGYNFAVQEISAYITLAPTIEPEVRHGRWIFGSSKTSCWMTCSICCKSQSGQTATFSYCPNCGARMDALKTCCCISDEEAKRILGGADNG